MSDMELDSIPPTEPTATATMAPPVKRGPGRPKGSANASPVAQTGGGAHLAPSAETLATRDEQRRWFWIGVTADCVCDNVDLGGENFPKLNEEIRVSGPAGEKVRIPVIGAVVQLTPAKLALMERALQRTVIRYHGGEEPNPRGAEDTKPKPRRRTGQLVRIPSAAELKAASERGYPMKPYVAQRGDEPVAKYLFCIPCAGNEPVRGLNYPPPLLQTGLTWPE